MRPKTNLLNILGVVYGLCWGFIGTVAVGLVVGIPAKGSNLEHYLGSPLAEVVFFVACLLTGIPVGLVVTRLCARWLRDGSAWRLLWVAPLSLVVGTMLLGLLHASIVQVYMLASGRPALDYLKNFAAFPFWYALGAFLILYVPVPLAFLTCWHLRRTMHKDPALTGRVWKVETNTHP